MSRTRAVLSLVLGALGVVVWVLLVAIVWRSVPPVGAGVAETAASVRASVATVHEHLGTVDDALERTDLTLEAFREKHADDPEVLRAHRRELETELAPLVAELRADLEAVRELVVSIDRLLETLDLPFLDTARRAGAERVAAIRERVPRLAGEGADLGLDLTPARALVGEARGQVATWHTSLDALDEDLSGVEARAPRLATTLCVVVTLLGLWSLLGQVCLVRAGWRGLRP